MSFSVDDLVSSLNSSHIGQEARDLAALQAQLAETLFGGQSLSGNGGFGSGGMSSYGRQMHVQIPTRGRSQHTQPCNTPLARTPSSSVGGYMESRRGSMSSVHSNVDDMEEDERMVEELLMPSSSSVASTSSAGSNSYHNFPSSSSSSISSPFYSPAPSNFQSPPPTPSYDSIPSSPSASLFTTTDPFYMAQLQASQAFSNGSNFNNTPAAQQQSGFASNGRLSQSSPFAMPQYHQMQYHNQNWENVSFKTCAAAF